MEKEPPKPLINFRVTPEFVTRLKRAAQTEDVSQTTFLKIAVQDKIEKVEKKIAAAIDK